LAQSTPKDVAPVKTAFPFIDNLEMYHTIIIRTLMQLVKMAWN